MSRLLIVNILDRKEKIMAEWVEKSLGEIAEVTKLAGFEFTKYIKYNDDGEIIALRALNLRNGEIDLTDIKRISREVSDGLTRSKIYKDDILLTYTGNGYGDCAIIEENDKYHLAPNICKIVPNTEAVFPYYLYCYIRSKAFYNQMSNNMTGSGQPTIPMKTIRLLKIPIPEMDVQVNIANMIWSLNQKIRNNKAINNNLEQQAKALYKDWFFDFSPFSTEGNLPDGWHLGTVGDIIQLHDSKRVPLSGSERDKMEKIYPYYGATSLMDYVDNYLFDGIYLLLGEDGTVIDSLGFPILQYVYGQFWVNNHAHIITGKEGFSVEELYLFFNLTNIKSIVTGAVQQKVSQQNLKKVPAIIPSKEALSAFDDLIQPIFVQIRNLRDENARLADLRDTILPRLMSGELDVSDIEI